MKPLYWDAINPFTGQPFTFDDPNVRWGFYLEPSDPEFVPYGPLPPSPTPTKNRTKMKRQDYYPTRQAEQALWLENFRLKLPTYHAALGLTSTETDPPIADARWLAYLLTLWLPAVRTFTKATTQAFQQAETGTGGPLALPVFTAPALPSGVVAMDEGALPRLFDFIASLKENDACTGTICDDLGIRGGEAGAPDYLTLRPTITATVTSAGNVIGWGWGGYSRFLDQCEIQVDRGSGYTILTFDTTPDYLDTAPVPTTLTKWKYRAIYRVGDAQVGLWSEEVTVVVGD